MDNTDPKALVTQAHMIQIIGAAVDFHWSDTDEGALHLDPFPNPKRFGIGTVGPVKIAVDCGPAGIGIGPGH